MNKNRHYVLYFSLLLSLFLFSKINSQVYNGDLFLATQTEIDNFNYTEVNGNLTIWESTPGNITSLNGLSELTTVGGIFGIYNNTALTNVDALTNLVTIAGAHESQLDINNNISLTNLDGLSNLTTVAWVTIRNNSSLLNIDGLSGLNGIGSNSFTNGSDLEIENNDALININGLSGVSVFGDDPFGYVSIRFNDALTEFCGLYTLFSNNNPAVVLISDNAANPAVQDIIDGGPCTPTNNEPAVILATNSIWLEASSDILSGNVVVNNISSGPTLDAGAELSVGIGSTTAQGYSLKANRIKVKPFAKVRSDVYYNSITNYGTVTGTHNAPLTLPVYSTLPQFLQAPAGTQNVTVAVNGSALLSAGNYKDIVVNRNGTLLLSGGGTFSVNSIKLSAKAKLLFDAPANVLIQNKFDSDLSCIVGPINGSGISGSDIILYISGINGNDAALGSLPKAAQVGLNNTVKANFYVPNGTLWLRGASEAAGSFIARDILVGLDVKISEDNAFSGNSLAKSASGKNGLEVQASTQIPEKFELAQNFPNPFNPTTKISFSIPVSAHVLLRVFDVLGSEVATLVNEEKPGGNYQVEFNGSSLSSGIYFYTLQAGEYKQSKKLILLK